MNANLYGTKKHVFHLDPRSYDQITYAQEVVKRMIDDPHISKNLVLRLAISHMTSYLSRMGERPEELFLNECEAMKTTIRNLKVGADGDFRINDFSHFGKQMPAFRDLWQAKKVKEAIL